MLTTTAAVILTLNVCSTMFLLGFIWFLQIIHYPLYSEIDAEKFSDYLSQSGQRSKYLMAIPMVVEAITSVLLIWHPPIASITALLIMGLGLVFVIWSSTLFFQIPNHNELHRGFRLPAFKMLYWTNWTRTIAWTLRGALVAWLTIETLFSLAG